ncbi:MULTISPECIES: type II toxin-antitoxin system RelE/ParE family toxin [Achromobacter]|uniref:type II toxin-antitoxin system RelE/ParE family toxin n=1 Tax=Achromobacter TaxID=222 RepID=UPI000332232A|nr:MULTISPECIES: type II toxin-antitoxin system RelE/ParE family toxin [Achromobacter]AHC49411.1 YafQ toxin protein [Achromobacter xylosoxidans NBRC 15126 = ATCC 27061]AXA79459.1 type II toxin-antitoxin system RelE/ParE family toxin [Achromobacter xylosoxidans]KAA5920323.1 type II toxin-antitoxin system RelE/ParE family toxin [Achromobacter xylosoxidans]KMJ87901.1 addiction module antitoxin [Achromobacter xylosoxidans]KOQ20341.1 addiction module antitoxin [Achromobacter xylosoxidans]
MPAVEWSSAARADLLAIVDYISDDNPDAAQRLKDDIETKAAQLPARPALYRPGRIAGTREMVVRANYIIVYAADALAVRILRILHAAQQWPPQ